MTDDTAAQERIFRTLAMPKGVVRIDTHGASVFLDGDHALKIKRAVRLPFLDYSTLDKRKAACEEEIRINRPLAPQIYHRVVAITEEPDGSVAIDGHGRPIDYAVDMARFDENLTLDHLAKAGPLDTELAPAIADAIAASHAQAAIADGTAWLNSIPALIDGNSAGLRRGDHLDPAAIDQLGHASHQAFLRVRATLEERARHGFVRRCHGDLHLGNIVLLDRQPVLFDAIEFDAEMATVDLLYDLAFTLMDLLRYDQADASNAVLNQYVNNTNVETIDGLAALPLFMSIRAAIRAQVALAKLARPDANGAAILDEAHRYFELARTLINPPSPRLIAVGGLSGTGKSLLARALAPTVVPQPGAIVLRSDVIRKQLFRVRHTDRLPPSTYRPDVTARVYEELMQRARRVLSQGHSAIVDAVFARESERDDLAALARECGVPLNGLFLVADLATRQARIGRRQGDASDATQEVAALQEHYKIGHLGWTIIDASGTPWQTLQGCRDAIAGDRAI